MPPIRALTAPSGFIITTAASWTRSLRPYLLMVRTAARRAASWTLGSSVVCTTMSALEATPFTVVSLVASSAAVSRK